MLNIFLEMISFVTTSLKHNWYALAFAIVIAAFMKVQIDPQKLKKALLKKTYVSIWGSVIVGAITPLCACGTMAVVIGMLTTALPWGPVMAFLTSSPLMSPDGFILLAGIINLKFAIAMAAASIIIGLGSGYLAHLIESKTNFLKNQTRFSDDTLQNSESCGCGPVPQKIRTQEIRVNSCCDNSSKDYLLQQVCCAGSDNINALAFEPVNEYKHEPLWNELSRIGLNSTLNSKMYSTVNLCFSFLKGIKWKEIFKEIVNTGLKQIVLYYIIFVAIGFLINRFVPSSWIVALFSGSNIFSVPLAALIGLPVYVSGESALPLINSLMAGGASGGAMLAFLITGPGTSAGVISGLTVFLKKKAIALYVFFLLFGAVLLGYLYDLIF